MTLPTFFITFTNMVLINHVVYVQTRNSAPVGGNWYCKVYTLAPNYTHFGAKLNIPAICDWKYQTRSVRQEERFSEQRSSIYGEKVST